MKREAYIDKGLKKIFEPYATKEDIRQMLEEFVKRVEAAIPTPQKNTAV